MMDHNEEINEKGDTELKADKENESAVISETQEPQETQDPVEALRAQLGQLEKAYAELNDKYIRLYAEFDNYKKRMAKEREENLKYSNEMLLKELLPVLDNLENALKHAKDGGENYPFVEGVRLTLNQFLSILQKFGVERIDSLNEKFDPLRHEAVDYIEKEGEDGIVVEELRKGYTYHKRLLRPSLVIVSKSAKTQDLSERKESD